MLETEDPEKQRKYKQALAEKKNAEAQIERVKWEITQKKEELAELADNGYCIPLGSCTPKQSLPPLRNELDKFWKQFHAAEATMKECTTEPEAPRAPGFTW